MPAEILRIDSRNPPGDLIQRAATWLERGEIVAIPTETVYGLAVDFKAVNGLERLIALKKRAPDKPVALATDSLDRARESARFEPRGAVRLAERYWPGPLTLILPRKDGSGTIGVRVPGHKVALEILRALGRPVYLSSANPSGEPAAVDGAQATESFQSSVACVVDSGRAAVAQPSTVVSFEGTRPLILREGLIDRVMVLKTAAHCVLIVCSGNTCRSPMAEILFRREWARQQKTREDLLLESGLIVTSAGTDSAAGWPATEEAVEAVRLLGADLTRHRSKRVTAEHAVQAHTILAMTQSHRALLSRIAPECASRIELLDPDGKEIHDPMGGGLEVYRSCARQMEDAIGARVRRIIDKETQISE